MRRASDLDGVACGPDMTVTEALVRLGESGYLFQIVVDGDGRLLGTLTDSDVRRGLLRGVTLDQPVSSCMQAQPITGRVGREEDNIDKFHRIPGLVTFLPVLDDDGRVSEVLIAEPSRKQCIGLVMAGGKGRRLGGLTKRTPKPLLPVGGRPILDRILERLEGHGIRSIYISVHHLAEQIEAFVLERHNSAKVELLREARPMGTAGALAKLPREHDGDILVMNGDILARADLSALEGFHHRHGYDATITVASYQVHMPFGVIQQGPHGEFHGIDEKPEHQYFVAAGIYLLSHQFCALVPDDEPINMPDLLNRGRSLGLRIGLFPVHEYWRDIGRPDDLMHADRDYRSAGNEPA